MWRLDRLKLYFWTMSWCVRPSVTELGLVRETSYFQDKTDVTFRRIDTAWENFFATLSLNQFYGIAMSLNPIQSIVLAKQFCSKTIYLFRILIAALPVLFSGQLSYAQTESGQNEHSSQAIEKEAFLNAMSKLKLPSAGKGCFMAAFPNKAWKTITCASAPKNAFLPAKGVRPTSVGNGQDFFLSTSGKISSLTGSFDSISGLVTEYGSRGNNVDVVYPDSYSLQLNTNFFPTSTCGGCTGWEQFIVSQGECYPNTCVFIEYWLIGHGSPCPGNAPWTYVQGAGCFFNTKATFLPRQMLADLSKLKLQGAAAVGGQDRALFSVANGDIYVASYPDNTLNLASNWSGAEYNLVGDCCFSQAYFNSGTQLNVRLSAFANSTNANCAGSLNGATGETNNLFLVASSCKTTPGSPLSLSFSQAGGGNLPIGTTIGDTHLTTFYGVHYDMQGVGDFELLQARSDFMVQTRQKQWSNPSVAVNSAVAATILGNKIAICLDKIVVNGMTPSIGSGASLVLKEGVTLARSGNSYILTAPTDDRLQADLMGDYMNVSVSLGLSNRDHIGGLLGGRQSNEKDNTTLMMRDGSSVNEPISGAAFAKFVDSWRVAPRDSILCGAPIARTGMPDKPIYAEDLNPSDRDRAAAVCEKLPIKSGILRNDCILDVGVLKKDAAAKIFETAPTPVRSIRPSP